MSMPEAQKLLIEQGLNLLTVGVVLTAISLCLLVAVLRVLSKIACRLNELPLHAGAAPVPQAAHAAPAGESPPDDVNIAIAIAVAATT
jgi:Na+-transporting methylmalonyl-CoA/oxaloacetate decarboxylase gamma subunit